jgi:hypothetical protein
MRRIGAQGEIAGRRETPLPLAEQAGDAAQCRGLFRVYRGR